MTHLQPARVPTDGAACFFVAGAAGATGARVTRLLLERGHHVRAFVHRTDERSEDLARAGADVVVGDLHDLDAVTAALQGTRAGYFVYPIAPGLIEATAVFAQGAHEAGLGGIVNMSQISARRDAASHAAQQHWIAERLLDRSPVPVTHLRPTFFAENLLLTATDVTEHGAIRMPMGQGRHAPVTVEDQAHVIAAILTDPSPHAGATYPLYGPVEMDFADIAQVFSTVLGRTVRYEPIGYDEFADQLTAIGFGSHLIQHLRHVSQDFQRGVFAGTNDVVQRIGHKTPVAVAEFVDQYRAIFQPVATPSGQPS
ncbi:NmrA family NAD(P)-binding protein [Mycobacterium sp.]|uniref:NmrA family NAD(P)-binding protein n=1 Tax=Mycobacterium sp. TaxID=1785 RepID=UPI003D0EF84F